MDVICTSSLYIRCSAHSYYFNKHALKTVPKFVHYTKKGFFSNAKSLRKLAFLSKGGILVAIVRWKEMV